MLIRNAKNIRSCEKYKKDFPWAYEAKVICLVLVSIFPCLHTKVVFAESTLTIGQNYTLTSRYLKEDRPYAVYLPEACKAGGSSRSCPVLYISDGESRFHYVSGMLQRMSIAGQIPPMIMVAIFNTTDRTRDLTPTHSLDDGYGRQDPSRSTSGGGERFLNFVEHELIPEVEANYQPMPYRILYGSSYGGLITLHSFVSRPALFQAHIASDPSLYWDNNKWLEQAEAILANMNTIKNRVYLSVAEHAPKGKMDDSNRFERPSERFAYALKANPSPHLQSLYQQFSEEDHGSVALPSLYYGLKFVFHGYKNLPPSVEVRGLESVKAYYRDYLKPYGIELSPPMGVISNLALIAELNQRYQESIEYYQYNISNNPEAAYGYYNLAETYRHIGYDHEAIEHYKKAMKLEPKLRMQIEIILANMSKR